MGSHPHYSQYLKIVACLPTTTIFACESSSVLYYPPSWSSITLNIEFEIIVIKWFFRWPLSHFLLIYQWQCLVSLLNREGGYRYHRSWWSTSSLLEFLQDTCEAHLLIIICWRRLGRSLILFSIILVFTSTFINAIATLNQYPCIWYHW